MRCAIFYGDGAVWHDWRHAPPLDVQAIVYPDETAEPANIGSVLLQGWDYYLLEGGAWVGVNKEIDLLDHILHQRPDRVLKGRMISKDKWHEVIGKAHAYAKEIGRSAHSRAFEEG